MGMNMVPNNNYQMNMNQMNMNEMNMNMNNYINLNNNFNVNNQSQQEVEDEEENVGDIIPICKEEKEKRKEIIFVKSDFSKKRVRIPSYIRKNEFII